MAAVSAIRTTGIYCLPECSAPPARPENIIRFPLSAAAEAAGFRACHRCRPYRSPGQLSWEQPELVCRAVRLILDGALDKKRTETDLAERLGISARHLSRLFTEHLGVTPDGLARSARVHFARRLLDDSDLSVAEVATAAGFGSIRQLNRACQEIFRDTPRALRARRRLRDRLIADGGLPLRLAYAGLLDWRTTASRLTAQATPGVEWVTDGVYRRTIIVDGDPGMLELSAAGDGELLLLAHLPHWGGLVHIVAKARRIACLDLDLDMARRSLAADPALAPLLRTHPGLRPIGTWDGFETGVRLIVARHLPPPAARAATGRLVKRLGQSVPGLEDFGLSHTFPPPETVAAGNLGNLRLPPGCASVLRAFASAVANDTIRLDGSACLDELVDSIGSLDGAGVRLAHALALRLGEPDAYPETSPAAVRRAESWRPWRAVAATHLSAAANKAA